MQDSIQGVTSNTNEAEVTRGVPGDAEPPGLPRGNGQHILVGVQDPGETDIDCGGPQLFSMNQPGNCPARCENSNSSRDGEIKALLTAAGVSVCVDWVTFDGT